MPSPTRTKAKSGFGTKIYRSDGAGSWLSIAEIHDVSGPSMSRNLIDATHMESDDGYTEDVPGLKDGGDVTFECNMIDPETSQGLLKTDFETGTVRDFRVVLPGGTRRWAFAAIVSAIGNSFPQDGRMVMPVTLAIQGKPVNEAHS